MSTRTYMNIKGQGHSMTLVQCHSDSTFSDFFYLETTRLIKTNVHMECPWDGGTKVSSNGSGHMTNMAGQIWSAMLLYGKMLKQ